MWYGHSHRKQSLYLLSSSPPHPHKLHRSKLAVRTSIFSIRMFRCLLLRMWEIASIARRWWNSRLSSTHPLAIGQWIGYMSTPSSLSLLLLSYSLTHLHLSRKISLPRNLLKRVSAQRSLIESWGWTPGWRRAMTSTMWPKILSSRSALCSTSPTTSCMPPTSSMPAMSMEAR